MLVETMRPSRKEANANMEALRKLAYPGRGIVMGLNEREDMAVQVYWITARSNDSKNRVIVVDGDMFHTDAFDWDAVKDPTYIIYNALRNVGNQHIVTNGDQTDTVADYLQKRRSLRRALRTRTFEQDPLSTPRISGLLTVGKKPGFEFSVIREGRNGKPVRSYFNSTKNITPGVGYCIHTYVGAEDAPRTFDKAPYPVLLEGRDVRDIAKNHWEFLAPQRKGDKDLRVALVVKAIDLKTGEIDYKIENTLGGNSPSSIRFKA